MKRLRKQNRNDASFWNGIYKDKDYWRDSSYKIFKEYPLFFKNKKILDIGCGLGDGIAYLAKLYPSGRYIGADFHIPCIIKAKTNYPKHKWFELNLEDRVYCVPFADTILIVQTLEHIKDPIKAVRQSIESCRHLIVTVPTGGSDALIHDHLWDFDKDDFKEFNPVVVRKITNRLLFIFQGDRRYEK